MDTREKAKRLIEARIRNLLNEFDFDKRKIKSPNECPCYLQNKPCHNIPEEDLNCFLCYCPEYNTENFLFSVSQPQESRILGAQKIFHRFSASPETQGLRDINSEEGRCNLGNPQGKGKWFYHEALPHGRIWDCCDCSYPHDKEVAEKYLKKMFGLK